MGYDTRLIGGTKGSHLILDHPELRAAIQENEFFFENKDGRLVLLFPLLDKVIVGTSDIPINDPETARCTEEEVDYFLEMISIVFPEIIVDRSHIIYRFSGVRPLPASDAATTSQISRDHRIEVLDPDEVLHFPIYNLIGGKWTSFRAFSEQATDKALACLNRHRQISTRDLAIGGGRDYPHADAAQQVWMDTISDRTGCEKERIRTLFERYGTRAADIAKDICDRDDALLRNLPDYSREEIKFIVREEKVLHLDDFLLRRSNLAKLGQLSRERLDEITDCIADELNWSVQKKQAEIQRFNEILLDRHGVRI
jgi:glycerol-3-phosphate dehydrogenase